ncbi:carbon storage regulator [Paenibacillus vortex V453]|jgi:carbon storage regulator|uniref:Translational regulator CsrA n=2 Tax=Paenibacillus TaxID=44249 RepID=A0A2R9SLF8_9BACL|nr:MULTISPECIES: carbon storage regulator CsrA [Paenibacillus]ANA79780.1 carbon storage regulator [Paenibacillus glucanolyticus]AVV56195.1 carbon storage regulator [Paenibacillus glucanolyticus]EFU38185.1 carbon storage regulator [Paenibacillus vortex V453]ETT38985.1 carbon storage regulator [Paenibacillus sp. FSL R5-808]MPY20069.1 carbon storage regulator CsrA [Paenibacillus glucanolyticus]
MLILSRNKGQKIMLNDNIILSVIEINGDQVRIGIEAPPNVTIYREEIYDAIQRQNKDAVEFTEDIHNILQKVTTQKNK